MKALLEGRISDATWSRGPLIAAESVSSSVRRLEIDRDEAFVAAVKIISSPNVRGFVSRSPSLSNWRYPM
jgi:hypothetical protein